MLFKRLSWVLALASAGAVSGCNNADKVEVLPAPTCYSGVVLGDRCWDGLLIQVDSQFPIGKAIAADSLGSSNVIAAVNPTDFGGLSKRGQRVYFTTYHVDPSRPTAPRFCTANNTALPIPHFVIDGVLGVPCDIPNH